MKYDKVKKKEYYIKNKEKILEYHKNYYAMNKTKIKDKTREYLKKYYQEHKEKMNADSRNYQKQHKEKYKEYEMKRSKKNKESYKLYQNGFVPTSYSVLIEAMDPKKYKRKYKSKYKGYTDKCKRHDAKRRNKKWIKIYPNIFPEDIPVDWHHIDGKIFVVALPRTLHQKYHSNTVDNHLINVNAWVEFYYDAYPFDIIGEI